MPVIKSAKKKLKQDRKKEKINDFLRKDLKNAVKVAKKSKTAEKIRLAVKIIDKSAKKGLIHKNKAARLKSSLSKLVKIPLSKIKSATKPRQTRLGTATKKTASKKTK